jgi:hypothetical protein
MNLYHFSEDATIERFEPRSPLLRPEAEPMVWAIDEAHSPLYYLPRDCPRVAFWPLTTTLPTDLDRFYSGVTARMVIAIEWGWLARLLTTRLYRYRFSTDTFEPLDLPGSAAFHGVYVSRSIVTPLQVEPLEGLVDRLGASDVELRLCPTLHPLCNALIESSMHFSCIRMRNAKR